MKILLDPGHGQYDNAGNTKGYYEGTQMFKLAYFLKPELEKYGITVDVTRKKVSDNPGVSARGKATKGYDLFLSLHSNAPGESAKKAGTYYTISGTCVYDSVSRPNKSLADRLGNAVSKVMDHKYLGTMYRKGSNGDYYGVLRNAIAVGVPSAMLIEHGFHTNEKDAVFLMSDANLKKLAQEEARVIAEYYGLVSGKGESTLLYGSVLRKGTKGSAVGRLQKDLISLGFGSHMDPYGVDNSYGGATERAVIAFQKKYNLKVDGIAGPETQRKIEELLKAQKPVTTDYKKLYEDLKKKLDEIKKIIG